TVDMDAGEDLPLSINSNNFHAKLWRLVNDPTSSAIRWDGSGQGILIEQKLFEKQFLCPGQNTQENNRVFRTTNFTSFIRQLNLYGFRKVVATFNDSNNLKCACSPATQHHFHNPNFKRNRPELLVNLKRLTSSNKAKLQAGMEVNSRPPSRHHRFLPRTDGGGTGIKDTRGGSLLLGQTYKESAHPYHPNRSQPMKEYNQTPVPPRTLMMDHGAASSPTIFATDKGIPVSFMHHFPGMAPTPSTLHIQHGLQDLPNPGSQKFSSFSPHHAQYKPGFYSIVRQCYPPGPVASNTTGGGPQTASFSHLGYYQPSCHESVLQHGNQSQDVQNDENQEMRKGDVNLDTVFQIADGLQAPSNICLVRMVSPEKEVSVSKPFTSVCSSTLPFFPHFVNSANTRQAIPPAQYVSNSGRPVKEEQQQRKTVPVPNEAVNKVRVR
uniref:HSF-type DNA-binding domain-containing protein n=1 Tax=Myripristis murdjan TaxID=586833 RepID=A0A668A8X5_9TELE